MPKYDPISDRQFIFGALLMLGNQMNTLLDRELAEFEVTTVQWFMTITLETMFEAPPTLQQVARLLSTSHQNIKQVALKLADKGWLTLAKDTHDRRITRLFLTDRCRQLWSQTDVKGADFMARLYDGLDDQDLLVTRQTLQKLVANLAQSDT
jgi:DNA-binding MarR family transcriptional regulator